MLSIENRTVDDVFCEAAALWPQADVLVATQTDTSPMRSLTYGELAAQVDATAQALRTAGYGFGQRAAVLMGSCPEHYVIKLALNRLGMSCVPVNPDYRPAELAYLLEDSDSVLAVAAAQYEPLMRDGMAEASTSPSFVRFEELLTDLPTAPRSAETGQAGPDTETDLLYTSGTTGKPKGCILTNEYTLMCGQSYALIGDPLSLQAGKDRVLNPLPSFHINSGIVTFLGCVLTGNCLIHPERFSASTWWRDAQETGATVFHYLGVVIPVLMADRDIGPEVLGNLRVGMGAGADPSLHVAFEERFGIPLVEGWGMTEMCRVMMVDSEPRMIDTRAIGRPRDDLQVRVVDQDDVDVPVGTPGEMLVRHSAETPRKGAFSGYLNKPEATAEAWKNDWFHTGDTVVQTEDGMIIFVDRAKNIIRRSGENIAAAEVENTLFEMDAVVNVAVIAVPDDIRDEEVMACIVLAPGVAGSEALARDIFDEAFRKMAYYKPPGYILFVDSLPVTGTQKVVKHQIFDADVDPRALPGTHDFRDLKKKSRAI